jgi:hypothetical protein
MSWQFSNDQGVGTRNVFSFHRQPVLLKLKALIGAEEKEGIVDLLLIMKYQ